MYDETHFARDETPVEFHDSAPGVETDDEGETTIDWDEVETVHIDDPPYAEAFDTKEFYKLPATVARPIPQLYRFGDDEVWLKKPRDELKRSAWSLDNAPWTMGHPSTTVVKDASDVRGFWAAPRYVDSMDDLDADMHIPVHDEDARSYVEDNGDVSVGFYNQIQRVDDYEGIVGGDDTDGTDLDGYQTSLVFDHVASVPRGRCSSEEGCGIDSAIDGLYKRTDITESDEDGVDSGTVSMQATTDAPSGIYTTDDQWFAIGPDEHSDDSTSHPDDAKYPVNSCSDVSDAWDLRGNGDYSIEQSTLANRIQRAAEAMDCEVPGEDMDGESDSACNTCNTSNEIMEFEIDRSDLTADAILRQVADEHEKVEAELSDLREKAEAADAAADELDLDCACDVGDEVESLRDERESLQSELDDLKREQAMEDAEFLAEHTDRFGEDAESVLDELDYDEVAEKRDLVEEFAETDESATTDKSVSPGGTADEDGGASSPGPGVSRSGEYVLTPDDVRED